MKIAFVGKGGSGKSTVSTQFFNYLISRGNNAAFIDADLNVHSPELLGAAIDSSNHLANANNAENIREYLKGTSRKISSVNHFYATTPPSVGVNLFEIENNNELIKNYFTQLGSGFVGAVGTYEKDAIGVSCYHDSLSILENILSFSKLSEEDWLVVDMVAGIDAFANSLYMQFDVLVLVVEPTREGIDVYRQYLELARHAGIGDRLRVIANKVEDEDDENFIKTSIQAEYFIDSLRLDKKIKKLRQQGEILPLIFSDDVFKSLISICKKLYRQPDEYLELLNKLHRKFVQQDYITNAVGDITEQIDGDFHY